MMAITALFLLVASVLHANIPLTTEAFTPSPFAATTTASTRIQHPHQNHQLHSSPTGSTTTPAKTLVVISPPGGLGEITAIEAATTGTSVRWFIISPPTTASPSPSLTMSSTSLSAIERNGGSVTLAGAPADTLLLPRSDPASAVPAVAAWLAATKGETGDDADGLVCVIDGIEEAVDRDVEFKEVKDMVMAREAMMDAIKIATREACAELTPGMRVAIVPSDMDLDEDIECEVDVDEGMVEKGGNKDLKEVQRLMGYVKNPFAGNEKVEIPTTLSKAMGAGCGGASRYATLRYGELFGLPESSVMASPFVGGPRRDPVIRDEYTMRSIRIDPTLSLSGNAMLSTTTRSSRLSLGNAAARMALSTLTPTLVNDLDVCLTSLRGMEIPDGAEWDDEFERVLELLKETGGGAQLFKAQFGNVPSVERLADWIATKWAPTVMRTYDIAGIRVGARPVFATRVGESSVEIEWQILTNFETNVVGKMTIEVEENAITAVRGAGDPNAGFGSVSRKPLPGEDILVRRLSDAVVQAVEKGLATKVKAKKREKKIETVEKPRTNTMMSSGNVAPEVTPAAVPSAAAASEAGPRSAGTRRSVKRKRGTRRKKEVGTESPAEESASTSTTPPPPVEESQSGSWQ